MVMVRVILVVLLALTPVAAGAQGASGQDSLTTGRPSGGVEPNDQIRLNRPAGGGVPAAEPSGPAVIMDVTPAETLRLFQSAGFDQVRLVEDKTGDYLRVQFGDAASFITFFNCTNGRCRSLLFTAFLDRKRGATLNLVNDYNLKTLHTKMARNSGGEIVLTMAVGLQKGVTAEYVRSFAPFWMQVHRDAVAWK